MGKIIRLRGCNLTFTKTQYQDDEPVTIAAADLDMYGGSVNQEDNTIRLNSSENYKHTDVPITSDVAKVTATVYVRNDTAVYSIIMADGEGHVLGYKTSPTGEGSVAKTLECNVPTGTTLCRLTNYSTSRAITYTLTRRVQ